MTKQEITKQQPYHIVYTNPAGETTSRYVYMQEVSQSSKGDFLMDCWDCTANGFRTFRMDRIDSIEKIEDTTALSMMDEIWQGIRTAKPVRHIKTDRGRELALQLIKDLQSIIVAAGTRR